MEGIFRKQVSTQLRRAQGGVKKTKSWLIYVLRLRQAASHPFLLESVMRENFDREDIRWLIEQLKLIQKSTPFIEQVGRWCEEQVRIQQTHEVPGLKLEGLGAGFDMIQQLERVNRHNEEEVVDLCRRCGNVPDDPFKPQVSKRYSARSPH